MMNIVRIAKVIALLAFFLPWAAVSCQGADMATATGIEMMQGKMTANPDFEREATNAFGGGRGGAFEPTITTSATNVPDLGINAFAIGAAVVILIGLGLSFLGGARAAARNTLVTSLLGIALAFAAFWWFQQSVLNNAGDGGGRGLGGGLGGQDAAMASSMISSMVQQRFGLWINMIALGFAAGAAALALAAKSEATAPPAAPHAA